MWEDRTDVARVILFCDIERPPSNSVSQWMNRTIGPHMIRAAATQSVDGEREGADHIFSLVYQVRALSLRISEWNEPFITY